MNLAARYPGFNNEEAAVLDQATRIRRRANAPKAQGRSSAAGPGLFTAEDLADAATFEGQRLTTVLSVRRSGTQGLLPVRREDLARLLWHGGRLVDSGTNEEGDWQKRTYPSAGGTHTITLYIDVAAVAGVRSGVYRFNAASCQLTSTDSDPSQLGELRDAVRNAARRNEAAPVTVLLLADPGRIVDRYEAPLTLLMRDAGVCAATIQLVATDLKLISSIIGVAGQVLDQPDGPLVCCGAIAIGSSSGATA